MSLTKAERLAIGGAVAPVIRRQGGSWRKVTLVGKDGQPVGEATATDVAMGVLARADIEFGVADSTKATHRKCPCGVPFRIKTNSRWCGACRKLFGLCRSCRREVSDSTAAEAAHAGRLPMCRRCRREKPPEPKHRPATMCGCGAEIPFAPGRPRARCATCSQLRCVDCGEPLSAGCAKNRAHRYKNRPDPPPPRCLRCLGVSNRKQRESQEEPCIGCGTMLPPRKAPRPSTSQPGRQCRVCAAISWRAAAKQITENVSAIVDAA